MLFLKRDEDWADKVASCDFDSLNETESRFRKSSIFFRIMLNTSMFLSRVARSKHQALNSTMSSCVEDWLHWSAQETLEVLEEKELWHLILKKYSFWMTWKIRLEASCFRWWTRLNEICFLWTDEKLNYFFWANWELNCSSWASWVLNNSSWIIRELNCFLRANWKLNCFLRVNWELNDSSWTIRELNCSLRANWRLNCFLRANWVEATSLASSKIFSSDQLRS